MSARPIRRATNGKSRSSRAMRRPAYIRKTQGGGKARGIQYHERRTRLIASSFCSLRNTDRIRTRNSVRPSEIAGPLIRKPLHGALIKNGPDVSAITYHLNALPSGKHLRRYARLGFIRGPAISLEYEDELFSERHDEKMRILLRLVNVFYYSFGDARCVI